MVIHHSGKKHWWTPGLPIARLRNPLQRSGESVLAGCDRCAPSQGRREMRFNHAGFTQYKLEKTRGSNRWHFPFRCYFWTSCAILLSHSTRIEHICDDQNLLDFTFTGYTLMPRRRLLAHMWSNNASLPCRTNNLTVPIPHVFASENSRTNQGKNYCTARVITNRRGLA